MSYSPAQKYPGATDSDPDYKNGKFRDNNPSTVPNGSPLKSIDRNELLALQEAIMSDCDFEYNGMPDTPQNSQMFRAYKASLSNNKNLLSNHNFINQAAGNLPTPDATPRNYPANYQLFNGVFAGSAAGISNLTYVNGLLSFSGGEFYLKVEKSGSLEYVSDYVASVAGFDGKPRTKGVSFSLIDSEYIVKVAVDALEDELGNQANLGSVKFEVGNIATHHDPYIENKEIMEVSPINNDWNGYFDPAHQESLPSPAGYPADSGAGGTIYNVNDEWSLGCFSGSAGNTISSDVDGVIFSGTIQKKYEFTNRQSGFIDVTKLSVYIKSQDGKEFFFKHGDIGVDIGVAQSANGVTITVTLLNSIFNVSGIDKIWRFFVTENVGRVVELSPEALIIKYLSSKGFDLSMNGYTINSNGVIIQWGSTPVGSSTEDVIGSFPIPFPTSVLSFYITATYSAGSGAIEYHAGREISNSQYAFRSSATGFGAVYLAIGK